MFEEIQSLRDNLEPKLRGKAVDCIKKRIQELIKKKDWNQVSSFFSEYANIFTENIPLLNIIKQEFNSVIDALFKSGTSNETILLNHLQALPWFDDFTDSNYRRGCIAERMVEFSKSVLIKISKLQEARTCYRNAHREDDVKRVQKILTDKVKSFRSNTVQFSPVLQNNPCYVKSQEEILKKLKKWQDQNDEIKFWNLKSEFSDFIIAIFDTPLKTYNNMGSIMESFVVIKKVELSQDGRVNAGDVVSQGERNNYHINQNLLLTYLNVFSKPVKEWLSSQENDFQIVECVGETFKQHLNWDENSYEYFMHGINAWISGYPEVALSFWLPFFETALRNQLCSFGEDIINPNSRSGIEDFIIFDGLIKRAYKHYDRGIVEYWRTVFATPNGLGWNLRNEFCHGILPISIMKSDVSAFAVFNAYLLLIIFLRPTDFPQ